MWKKKTEEEVRGCDGRKVPPDTSGFEDGSGGAGPLEAVKDRETVSPPEPLAGQLTSRY